ncbi:helix-turn-helix domain-containing protein [Sphaerisporangium aureirubrum]|uniref:Helix-turn-helix domain-containing protein n=1 Tax=Sphaerisporangium aureirubrum TaxID=1544736 RepID=A0ABW1NDE9_9ACTN
MARTGVLARATHVEPVSSDHDVLAELQTTHPRAQLVLRESGGHDIVLPQGLVRLVLAVAEDLAAGNAVLALPLETLLTPQEAAQLLGLSRPFVSRLLNDGEIPSRHLPDSRHRLIRLTDLLEFQTRREQRAEGRRRIMEIAEEANLPY